MKEHITKDGKSIPLDKLADRHLENIIKSIEKRATEGVPAFQKTGPDEIKDTVVFGSDALDVLNYQDYIDELNSRKAAQG